MTLRSKPAMPITDLLQLATTDPSGVPAAAMKTIALVIFFSLFGGLLVWLLLVRSHRFDRSANLPLDDDAVTEPRHADEDPING